MKRSRSESLASSSSSGDNSSDSDTGTISSHDSSELEERSPKPNCVNGSNRTSSNKSKQGSSTSSSSSSKRTVSSTVTSQTKHSQYSSDKKAQQSSQTASKKIKNGNASHASPTKRSKAALPKKKQIIEVIDFSTSEYSPSDDEDGTESSSSSESKKDTHKEKKPDYKTIKLDSKDVRKAEPSCKIARTKKSNHKKHVSGSHRTEGKEFTRFTRGKCFFKSILWFILLFINPFSFYILKIDEDAAIMVSIIVQYVKDLSC